MQRINISTDDAEVTLYYNLIQSSIGFKPRSMKRLFNTFELLDIVTEEIVWHNGSTGDYKIRTTKTRSYDRVFVDKS